MRRRSTTRHWLVALACCLVLPLSACISMPESGPVVETGSEGDADLQRAPYIDPEPPRPGASPADIVAGFIQAMTATPMQTNDARDFLASADRASWRPQSRTITSSETLQPRGSGPVTVKLFGAEYVDSRGSFQGPLPKGERTLSFPMVREDGEWRIADPPDALIVPENWFEQRFTQALLYFFDPSAGILVPEPVFVPIGDQFATALVDSLLRGPGDRLDGVTRSFIPPGLRYDLSVQVSEDGVAELDLTGYSGQLNPEASELMLAQLAWTLRQEPDITSLRVTLGGQPVALPGGVSQINVQEGSEFDPTGIQSSSLLFGLRGGRLVAGAPDALAPVDGPMGTSNLGVRSIAVNLNASQVAGVTGAGDRVLVTTVRGGSRVEEVVSGAEDLLRPAWDFADRLWLVDDSAEGARISYVLGKRVRPVDIPGITGRRVTRFLVSRDGSRLVAVVRRPRGDVLMSSRIRHDGQGRVDGATPARRLVLEGETDLVVRDIGWSSPTSVAVLHRAAKELFQVRTIAVDGAPSGVDDLLTTLTGRVGALAASPVRTEPLYAVTASSLVDPRGESPAAGLDSDVTQVGYVG
jgi:hypothetical protein